MNKRLSNLFIIALLAFGCLTLTSCNKTTSLKTTSGTKAPTSQTAEPTTKAPTATETKAPTTNAPENATTKVPTTVVTTTVCNHEYTSSVEKEATCTEMGITRYTCQCGDTYTEPINKIDHTPETLAGKEPTCTSIGYTEGSDCSVCHTVLVEQKSLPMVKHDYEEKICAPTCLEAGYYYSECTYGCGTIEKGDAIPATGHDTIGQTWTDAGNEVSTTKDYCYYKVETTTCKNCKETVTNRTGVSEHSYTCTISKEATCAADGSYRYACSICNTEYFESFSNGEAHTWDLGVYNDATGITTYTCCNDKNHTKTAITGTAKAEVKAEQLISAGEVVLEKASITLDESTKKQLEGAGNVSISAEEKKGSDFVQTLTEENKKYADRLSNSPVYDLTMTVDSNQTHTFDGKLTVTLPYTLTEGEDVNNIAIFYLNDNGSVEIMSAKYSNGYVTFETNHFSKYTVVRLTPEERCAKYGHDNRRVVVPMTCESDGYTLTVCTVCHQEEKTNITPAAHSLHTEKIEATCQHGGYTKVTCDNCNYLTISDEVSKINHSMITIKTIDASCEEIGVITKACEYCRYTIDETSPALGHNYKEKEIVAPSCGSDGYTVYECERCQNTKRDNIVKTDGKHNMVVTDSKEATCTDRGYITRTCTMCNESETEHLKALGHDYVDGTCTRCGDVEVIKPVTDATIYDNLIHSIVTEGYTITAKDVVVNVKMSSETEIITCKFGTVTIGYVDGEWIGGGEFTMDGEVTYSSGSGSQKVRAVGHAVIIDGQVYMLDTQTGANPGRYILSINANTLVEYVLDSLVSEISYSIGNGSYEVLMSVIEDYINGEDINEIVGAFIDESAIYKTIISFLFKEEKTDNGYAFTLNQSEVAETIYEYLFEKSFKELFDAITKEGAYDSIVSYAKSALDKKLGDIADDMIDFAEGYDVNVKDIYALIEAYVEEIAGEKISVEEMIKQYSDYTVLYVVYGMMGGDPDNEEIVWSDVKTRLIEMIDQYASIGEYNLDKMVKNQMIPTDVYQTIKNILDLVKGLKSEIVINTDKDGNIVSLAISLNDKYDIDERNSVDAKGDILIEFNKTKMEKDYTSIYDEFKAEEKALMDYYKKAADAGEISKDENGDYYYSTKDEDDYTNQTANGTEVITQSTIHYLTSNGKLVGFAFSDGCGDWLMGRAYEKVSYVTITETYDFDGNKTGSITTTWFTSLSTMSIYLNRKTGEFGSWEDATHKMNCVTEGEEVCGSIVKRIYTCEKCGYSHSYTTVYSHPYYNNTQSNEIYDDLGRLVSYDEMGICGKCNEVARYVHYEYVYGENCNVTCTYTDKLTNETGSYETTKHEKEIECATLLPGSKTCEDGVLVERMCLACGTTFSSYTCSWHNRFVQDRVELEGSENAYLLVYGCACGQYREAYVEGDCKFDYIWGGNNACIYRCCIENCAYTYMITEENSYKELGNCQYTKINGRIYYFGITVTDLNATTEEMVKQAKATAKSVFEFISENTYTSHNMTYDIDTYEDTDEIGSYREEYKSHCVNCGYMEHYTRTVTQLGNCKERVVYQDFVKDYTEDYTRTNHNIIPVFSEVSCTQYYYEGYICIKCGTVEKEMDYKEPAMHSYVYDKENNTYVCSICGDTNNTGANGYFVMEDMSSSGCLTVGYYNCENRQYFIHFYAGYGSDNAVLLDGKVKYDNLLIRQSGRITVSYAELTALYEELKLNIENALFSVVIEVYDEKSNTYIEHVLTFDNKKIEKLMQGRDFAHAKAISLNEEEYVNIVTGGDKIYFSFTATVDGTYSFKSLGDYDTTGSAYDSSYYVLDTNDDYNDMNFNVFVTMKAGETCYFVARLLSDNNTGNFKVILTQTK